MPRHEFDEDVESEESEEIQELTDESTFLTIKETTIHITGDNNVINFYI